LRVRRFLNLSPETRMRLRQRYVSLAKEYPDDPVARKYVALIDRSLSRTGIDSALGQDPSPSPLNRTSPAPSRGLAPSASEHRR
jgi:hypothetical protein